MCSQSSFGWVSPFRNRRIKGYLLLPGAYRSLSRLSSALSAKASTICSFMLDQIDSYRFKIWTSAPSVVLIWFRFYILNCFVVYRNHLVLILGYWLFTISIPRMSWYFIWYSMCSFQGTVSSLIFYICLTFMVLRHVDQLLSVSGDKGIRTLDPLLARQVLSQLSYTPIRVGLNGLEPSTSRLSGVRSNQLSYNPIQSGSHLFCHTVTSIVSSAA